MEINMFLEPVSEKCFTETTRPGKNAFGETISIYRKEDDFPDLENVQLVLFGIKEERGAIDNRGCGDGID